MPWGKGNCHPKTAFTASAPKGTFNNLFIPISEAEVALPHSEAEIPSVRLSANLLSERSEKGGEQTQEGSLLRPVTGCMPVTSSIATPPGGS